MNTYICALALFLASGLLSLKGEGPVPVAAGFPNWQGLDDKEYVFGRELSPSDLRHKVTVIVEMDFGNKEEDHLLNIAKLVKLTGLFNAVGVGGSWEDAKLPRDVIVLVNVKDVKAEKLQEILARNEKDADRMNVARAVLRCKGCSYYRSVTFTGAPEDGGKRPFVYVMGPTGTEPLFKGEMSNAGVDAAMKAIEKGKKEIENWEQPWRPFFGNIAEPKFNTTLAKALEKGKMSKKAPLGAIEKALLGEIKSSEGERAKESQVLYDALVQTRSDLILRIQLEAIPCPHRAYYDIQVLLKHWPGEAKRINSTIARIRSIPEGDLLGKIFTKIVQWSDLDFRCKSAGEAKRIVAELSKIKKTLSPLTESKKIVVQNSALILDMKVDELIVLMPTKIAGG